MKKGIKKQGKTQSVTQMTYHEQKQEKGDSHQQISLPFTLKPTIPNWNYQSASLSNPFCGKPLVPQTNGLRPSPHSACPVTSIHFSHRNKDFHQLFGRHRFRKDFIVLFIHFKRVVRIYNLLCLAVKLRFMRSAASSSVNSDSSFPPKSAGNGGVLRCDIKSCW